MVAVVVGGGRVGGAKLLHCKSNRITPPYKLEDESDQFVFKFSLHHRNSHEES
jgi:hypothetical protein